MSKLSSLIPPVFTSLTPSYIGNLLTFISIANNTFIMPYLFALLSTTQLVCISSKDWGGALAAGRCVGCFLLGWRKTLRASGDVCFESKFLS